MAYYVMLTRLTDQGAQTLKRNPQHVFEVDEQLSAMGLKVLHQYAVLGRYDFVNVVEAPDDLAVTRVSLELASRGSIRLETMRAIPVEDLVDGLKRM